MIADPTQVQTNIITTGGVAITQGGGGSHMWYRKPDGTITFGAIGKAGMETFRYMQQGWEPLRKYGQFDWGYYYTDHPYEVLFQRGGAKDMPAKQVLEMGYQYACDCSDAGHIVKGHRPPLVPVCGKTVGMEHKYHSQNCWIGAEPVKFPQLNGREMGRPPVSKFCDDEMRFPSERARE